MPKTAEFKIVKIEGRKLSYRLDIPARWSETGKRQRRFFATHGEASGWAATSKRKRQHGRERETLLPDHMRQQAVQALGLLPPGVSLVEAVETFVACRAVLDAAGGANMLAAAQAFADGLDVRRASIPFSELLPTFAEAPTKKTRRRKSDAYRTQITGLANRLDPLFGPILVCDLDAPAIEGGVASVIPEGSREAAYKVLGAAFSMAVRKGWAAANPCAGIEHFSREIEEARIPSANQARALLAVADTPEILAYAALSLFAGTRDSETRRLRWENILWTTDEIELKAAPGRKAASGRFIRLESNLREWLLPLRKRTGLVCGGLDKDAAGARMKRLRRLADRELRAAAMPDTGEDEATLLDGWQRDLMRHGAACMWAALHGIPKACQWLGHGEDVHRTHYRRPVSEAEAKAYFSIRPAMAANVVEMTA